MILAISRAERFSPNSVAKDAAILDAVCERLRERGHEVCTVSEEGDGWSGGKVGLCLTMGRLPETLARLGAMERQGTLVVNSPRGVDLCCHRARLAEVLGREGVPQPPVEGEGGYWLKRADGCAEAKGDIRYAADALERDLELARMHAEGMGDILVQAHVAGDLVKFYGVAGTDFFRAFYPGDDGESKFGDELRNGKPRHYAYDPEALRRVGETAARAAGVAVYGGDAIVDADGRPWLIDFNDWPSFSRCREEAAEAIAGMVDNLMKTNCQARPC